MNYLLFINGKLYASGSMQHIKECIQEYRLIVPIFHVKIIEGTDESIASLIHLLTNKEVV